MNRRGIFSGLLAAMGLGAQTRYYETDQVAGVQDRGNREAWRIEKSGNAFLGKSTPVNNQCPVCGTMAEPHQPGLIFNMADECRDRNGRTTACSKAPRIIRCSRCNAAFWQDAQI